VTFVRAARCAGVTILVETYYVAARHVWMNRVPGGMVLNNEYLHRDQAVEHGRELAELLGGRHEVCSLVPAPRAGSDDLVAQLLVQPATP